MFRILLVRSSGSEDGNITSSKKSFKAKMTINFTEFFKRSLCCLIRNPKREITYAWLFSLLLVLVAFIVACIAAARLSSEGTADSIAGFAAMWTALLLIFISVLGTIIMRRFQTALGIGFLLGIIFIMTQQMLIVFAIFAERAQDPSNSLVITQSEEAMAVFAFFIFFVYSAYATMLAVFRDDIIKVEVPTSDPHEFNPQDVEDNQI